VTRLGTSLYHRIYGIILATFSPLVKRIFKIAARAGLPAPFFARRVRRKGALRAPY